MHTLSETEFFIAMVVIGEREVQETEFILPTLTEFTQNLYRNTQVCMGQRWLIINVTDSQVLGDVKQLIEIRVKSKKNSKKRLRNQTFFIFERNGIMNKTSQSISKRKKSTQNLIGIETFSRYGLKTNKSELAFFMVSPTNISVLSQANIDVKIHHLMALLSTVPEIEIVCLDSCECFDENKLNIQKRLREETNENVRKVLNSDLEFLDHIQVEMSTARQFIFCIRAKKEKQEQVFHFINRVQKAISEHGFEAKLMSKSDIKRMLAIYFEASMSGEEISDIEGMEYFNLAKEGMGNV